MPSLLPGYEYDVFISYRQNDNRGGWVTEFVKSLQEELSATIKDPVSVYFDVNPHDGLLETHQVGKSLEGKLKCLVFIPIISQTYSDPKSFAWQHEFCAFNRIANEDQFGRDIRLSGGNVASRILPVKIHDLDREDQKLFENELGGPLRAVEFIYREAGVNRPLTVSDSRNSNLNKTEYRNQVNKTAIAVKELLSALKNGSANKTRVQLETSPSKKTKFQTTKILVTMSALAVVSLFAYGLLKYPTFASSDESSLIPRVAVLPFQAIGEGSEYFAAGMKEALVRHLRANERLSVPPSLASTDRYANTTLSPSEIANELRADFLIRSTAQKWVDSIRFVIELIDPKKDEIRWTKSYRSTYANVFEVQERMAADISTSLQVGLSGTAMQKIKRIPTQNIEAYDLFLQVRDLERKLNPSNLRKGRRMLRRCIELDPTFAEAYIYLAASYFGPNATTVEQDSIEWLLDKGLEIYPDSKVAINLKCQSLFFHRQDTVGSFRLAETTLEQSPNDPETVPILAWVGWLYEYWLKDGREIKALPYYLKAFQLDRDYKEKNLNILASLGLFFSHIGDYSRAELILRAAMDREPDVEQWHRQMAFLFLSSGQYEKLEELTYDLETRNTKYSMNNFSYLVWRGNALFNSGKFKEGLAAFDEFSKHETMDGFNPIYSLLLEKNGFRSKAEDHWKKTIDIELKEDEPSHFTLARCYAKLGDKERALLHFEQITFTHTNPWGNADYFSRDLMLQSLWNEPRFVNRIKTEQDRLKGIRDRLAKMEADKIISVPQFFGKSSPLPQ